MRATIHCLACGVRGDIAAEQRTVRSNVRRFRAESFSIWRCRACLSVHARDEVDLAPYYRHYPFHGLPEDWRLRVVHEHLLRRLRRAGVRPHHSLLDYGCGEGAFVRYLRKRGFHRAFGYDRYSNDYSNEESLGRRYDCVLAQDVLEHVEVPGALLDEFQRLTGANGVIAIGTPNAEAIDLTKPERHVHTLHLPYHRHVFSRRALLVAGAARGWKVERVYDTQYANTVFPFMNSRFYFHYMRLHDDSLESLMEPPALARVLRQLPFTLFLAFFGYFFAEPLDMMIIFRPSSGGS